jgi:hypothetical protein
MRVGPRAYSLAPADPRPRIAIALAVTLLTLYGAALRADALVATLGPIGAGGVVRLVERVAAPVGARLRPRSVTWRHDTTPYTGGDPINYIRYAREMRGFYQPHVREPVFLALTRGFLWLLDNRDLAVSYASAFASVLVIPATYLVGAAAFGPAVGLLAAGAWAIEFDAIKWSVGGWRDDTFTLFFALTAWSYLRLRQTAAPHHGVVAGLVSAGACLTRLSSLLFAVGGLVWLVVEPATGVARARVARAVGIAAVVATLVTGPYLVSCWATTGDPFYAVNYHTQFYRHAQGLPASVPESAAHFVGRQFTTRPIAALDTAAGGLFAWPFASKWRGFRPWFHRLPDILRWSAAAGLVLMLWSANGRLLIVLLMLSLAPYALTHSLRGGGAWRFSEHVYPIYLAAAFHAWQQAARAGRALWRSRQNWRSWRTAVPRRRLTEVAIAASALAVLLVVYHGLPLLVVREALAASDEVMVEAGARERWFFSGAWSGPRRMGPVVVVRVAEAQHVGLRFQLPKPMAFQLTLKMDPAETADMGRQPWVTVLWNRQRLGEVHMSRDPSRMGAYRFEVPRDLTRAGLNSLELVGSHTVAASEAGRMFAWLDRQTPVAFRLWYVRFQPSSR